MRSDVVQRYPLVKKIEKGILLMSTLPVMTPLSELKPGQGGVIAHLEMDMPGHFQKLMAMGVFPGDTVTLLHRYPSFVFEAGFSQFAVDESIAARIYVRLFS